MAKPRPARVRKPASRLAPSERGSGGSGVTLTLTDSQVTRVLAIVGEGLPGGSLIPLARGGKDAWRERVRQLESANDPGMSQSLLRGLLVLACFRDGSWLKIKDVADATGASMSRTHRYVTTLLAAGVLEQEPHKRLYRLMERA